MMEPFPYLLISAAQWSRLRDSSAQVLSDWMAHWLPHMVQGEMHCEDAFAAQVSCVNEAPREQHPTWRSYAAAGLTMIHAEMTTPLRSAFAEAGFGAVVNRFDASGTGPSQLMNGVIDAALVDLAARFVQMAGAGGADALIMSEHDDAPGVHLIRHGSGAARVRWSLGQARAQVILGGVLVRQLLAMPPRPRAFNTVLTPLAHCILPRPLALRAWAGDVEISLGEVRGLAAGDVVRLDQRVDQPFLLTLGDATVAARGYLGSSHGRKALRLVSPHSTPEHHT